MAAPRMTSQTLRILEAMLSDPVGDWYGLQLSEEAGLKSGTIYPALARLEHYGWLESHWEDVDPSSAGRPRRRLYRLTREGTAISRTLLAERGIEAKAKAWRPLIPRFGKASLG